ncbi:hypothetical protein BO71DRAFT_348650, partial [Aspergillus ellipticus CBS 707.79]
MPRQPVSPLSLETCSPSPPDLKDDPLAGSDDDLDDDERAAQHQRIERLAEAYLQGTPLFILSASLRGPLDKGWTNPWRKNRRKATGSEQKAGQKQQTSERPMVPETNTRKRPLYRDSQDVSHPKAPVPRADPAYSSKEESRCNASGEPKLKRARESRTGTTSSVGTPKRTMPWKRAIGSSGQASASTPFQHTDESWLKKDCVGIGFRKVDPPTSPTTSISSRHRETKDYTIQVPGTTYRIATKPFRRDRTHSQDDTANGTQIPDSVKAQLINKNADAQSNLPGPSSEADEQQNSLHVLSSTSHLAKFEYRRIKSPRNTTDDVKSSVISPVRNDAHPDQATTAEDDQGSCQAPTAQSAASVQVIEANLSNDHNINGSDVAKQSTTDHLSTLQSERVQPIKDPDGANISDRFPSAQQVSRNPTMEHTSLHTISAAKPHSCDGDTIPDPEFNTQAALLHAQKSFQDDLGSPEHTPEATPNRTSTPANNITPFYRMNTPDTVGQFSRARAPATARLPLMSTQCIIDAVTPFTFSTEKKARPRFMSPREPMSNRNGPGTVSFDMSSSPASENDNDDDPTIIPPRSPLYQDIADDTQIGALPMTLSDPNPPTVQDGQGAAPGADSFNESQAIAEIGSWLQQSFEVNSEIQQCRNTKPGPSSSAGIGRSS